MKDINVKWVLFAGFQNFSIIFQTQVFTNSGNELIVNDT